MWLMYAMHAACRSVYQRAVVAPTAALDALWQEYEGFENRSGNRQLAQRVLAEYKPKYMAAHAVAAERLSLVSALDGNALALPPGTASQLNSNLLYLSCQLKHLKHHLH